MFIELEQMDVVRLYHDIETNEAHEGADANTIVNNSLTENVIRQNYIDALREIGKNGNLVVVPQGSTPLIQTGE